MIQNIGNRGNTEGSYQYPARIDSDRNGKIYVLDSLGKKVIIYAQNGKYINEFYYRVRAARDFSVSPDGNIFIPDYQNSQLLVYGPGGNLLSEKPFPQGSMQGMVKNPDGAAILFTEQDLYCVGFLNSKGNLLKKKFLAISQPQFLLNGGALDKKERFYSWDLHKSLILGTDSSGKLLWVKNSISGIKQKYFNMPYDLSVDAEGKQIYIVDMQNKRIVSFLRHRFSPNKKNAPYYYHRALKAPYPLRLAYLNRSIAMDQRYIQPRLLRGKYYAEAGHHSRAIKEFRQVLAIKRNNQTAKAAEKKSRLALKLSDANYFSMKFREALKTGPESARPFYEMAVKAYEAAIKIDAGNEKAASEYQALVATFKSASGITSTPPVSVTNTKINDVFSSMYKYYADNSFGYVTVNNRTGSVIDRIHATVQIRGYMDYPTETRVRRNIAPGESVTLKIFAVFNNKILKISEDTPLSARIVIHYTGGGVKEPSSPAVPLPLITEMQ